MIDKVQKIREEVERLMNELIQEKEKGFDSDIDDACILELQNVLTFIDSLQEEPVSEQNLSNVERIGKDWKEEPVSKDFKKFEEQYLEKEKDGIISVYDRHAGLVDGAQWQKENLWKPADGDDLPKIDREVIVLIKYNAQRNIHDEEYPTYRVGFGHRPNPNGWNGKNLDTGEVTHYEPKLYDKGGWNAPDIVYWLDIELPKEIEP